MYLIFSNCTHLKEFSQYTAVSRKVVLQTGKSLATMSKVIMGNGDFYSCLSLKVFQPGGGKQHKHVYSFFLFPCCWITLNPNQAEPNSYYP